MKESEASAGTMLYAVICALHSRRTFRTCIGEIETQAHSSWDDLAKSLLVAQVEVMEQVRDVQTKPQLKLVK